MRHLSLGKQFRPSTSHVYPPFKHGRYMEEYVYDYFLQHDIMTDAVYLPIFWTNLQNHPGFQQMKPKYNALLQTALQSMPATVYFTIVQHDDGPLLDLPPHTIIFGACTGSIPLPLIYEDSSNRLLQEARLEKTYLASFVGSLTHPVREQLCNAIKDNDDMFCQGKKGWSSSVPHEAADQFVSITLQSKFCLAPRGYGRSSFRFVEAMLLDTIPVYIWDDLCWLPYQEHIDYSAFSICIQEKEMNKTHEILSQISEERYKEMKEAMQQIRPLFTLEWMCHYIRDTIVHHHFL